jgi:UDP-glucuronate 4-epimerase
MAIIVTGAAGFIGHNCALALLAQGHEVIGLDNVNDYYDPSLKEARLKRFEGQKGFTFHRVNIADREAIDTIFKQHEGSITHVLHLAAQAGVRYSLVNPYAYVESNLMGQVVLLEAARKLPKLEHFAYASSSSVYGGNDKLPFSIHDPVNTPVSLYAATKRADELMTHTFSHVYRLPATGLRFFTVYGPWGRPDMAYFSFTQAILANKPITVFDNGEMYRDFTWIDDIVSGTLAALFTPPGGSLNTPAAAQDDNLAASRSRSGDDIKSPPHRVFNLGNHKSEKLMDFIHIIEDALGKKAIIEFKPRPPGDVPATYADISDSTRELGFHPTTPISVGIPKFVEWYKGYYGV